MAILINNLVIVDSKYGIGKVVDIIDNYADVRFFQNITKQFIERFRINELKLAYLSPQTRVYIKGDDGTWKIGRVRSYDFANKPIMDYSIRFPNKKDYWYTSDDLEVRCLLPLEDPTEVLSTSGGESQFLYDSRVKVLEWLINLRVASRGLTSVTSASIDLVVHQINIARKILSDPIQRYLLSDEVGMGKTIEAGIVAKQCLLDSTSHNVWIIVPQHLISKWKREMSSRFSLEYYFERIKIITPEKIIHQEGIPELIIIDEAHHIIGDRNTYPDSIREKIIFLAQQSNKLLLLSATPGIGNEDILLSLLKVLDPAIYKDETLDKFKEKLKRQTEHGVFLRTLKTNQSEFLLKRNLSKVSDLFPNDLYAKNLASKLLTSLGIESEEQEVNSLIIQLRSHLTETWRLHNRLIRTRRIDTEGWEFQDRGLKNGNEYNKENIKVITQPNSNVEDINESIEEWRSHLASNIDDLSIKKLTEIINRYISLLETSNADYEIFKKVIKEYIKCPVFSSEIKFLNDINDVISEYNYDMSINELSLNIKSFLNDIESTSIGVLFVTDPHLAEKYLISLQKVIGNEKVLLFNEFNNSSYDLNVDLDIRIIICDKSSEEGVDFQFADAIIHLDLPLNPSRIEQRIGRLDRYGRTKTNKIKHLIILPSDNDLHPWKVWKELLSDGFGIFNEPISDVQLKLEEITFGLHQNLFKFGSTGLEHDFNENDDIVGPLIESIQSLIISERESLDEQYALNHLSLQESDSLNLRDEIEDSEYDEKKLENDINHWLFKVLKFYKWKCDNKAFEIKWSDKSTLVPKQQFWDMDNIYTTDMWEGEFKSSLDRKLSYYRKESVENGDISLLRLGHPLFFTLQHYMEWEDRGTTFSTYRVVDDKFPIIIPQGDIRIMFKLHFIVEAGSPFKEKEHEYNSNRHVYMRRADDYFPPQIFTVYIDEDLNIIENKEIIDTLDEPYFSHKKVDTNMGSRRYIIDYFMDPDKLTTLCNDISLKSKNILLNNPEFKKTHNDLLKKMDVEIETKCVKIKRRQEIQQKLNQQIDVNEYEEAIAFEKSLKESIENLSIKLDAFGMFFLSKFPISEMDIPDE
jgi:ATP-dependent helicase HepA